MIRLIKTLLCLQVPALLLTAAAAEPMEAGSRADHESKFPKPGNAARGKELFAQEFPNVHGNGRTCATCHVPEKAFQLTPGHVKATLRRYQLDCEGVRRVIPDVLPWPLRPDPITDAEFAPLIAYLKKI